MTLVVYACHPKHKRRALLLTLLVLFSLASSSRSAASSSDSKCTTGKTFTCPNCGGTELSDCLDCTGYLSTDTVHNMCIDRKLFQTHNTDRDDFENHYHYLWNDLVGMVVWFLTAGVATACGVGGGGIYVPLGILLLQFAPKQASGLSQASIFGASLGGLFLNIRNRHPQTRIRSDPGVADPDQKKNRTLQKDLDKPQEERYVQEGGKFYTRPLINYDMALFLAPMEMAGAVLGVLVQKVLPNWLYLLIAGVVLSFTAYKTYKKYFASRAAEKAAEEKKRREQEQLVEELEADKDVEEASSSQEEEETNITSNEETEDEVSQDKQEIDPPDSAKEGVPEDAIEMAVPAATDGKKKDDDEKAAPVEARLEEQAVQDGQTSEEHHKTDAEWRREYLEKDSRQYPREKLMALGILWVGLFLLTLFKGGKGVESLVGITCDSPWYAVLIVLQFLWIFSFAVYFGIKLVRGQGKRVAVQYPYLPDDPVWDRKALRFYGIFTFIAGIVAGLIGIGGGMVLGPLMLVMGIHPRVSSATTATMIVLTSSSVAVIFVTSGLVPWSYAVFYFCVCLAGALIGKSKIDGYIKRTGRASLLVFILATIIALATLGCFVILFTRLADKDWCLDGFNKFCTIDNEEECAANRILNGIASLTGAPGDSGIFEDY